MRTAILLGLALIASVPACIERSAGDPVDLRAFLAEPQPLVIAPAESIIELGVAREREGGQTDRAFVDLPIVDGTVTVATVDGELVLDDVTVALAPVELPGDIYPGNTRLVDVRIDLPETAPCERTMWSDDGASASCQVTIDLKVDWSLEIDGSPHPLGAITLAELPAELRLATVSDALRVDLEAKTDGELWSWLDVIYFSDLTLALRGYLD